MQKLWNRICQETQFSFLVLWKDNFTMHKISADSRIPNITDVNLTKSKGNPVAP